MSIRVGSAGRETNGSQASIGDLRRISFLDTETGKRLVFITNNFEIDAIVIAKIYKARWQIELFFKWIKQNRRGKQRAQIFTFLSKRFSSFHLFEVEIRD